MLQERPELQVICEVADGLEAVQKAGELKPDLIVLDIGLPKLNGIEAARQIRQLSPSSKIIFLSQDNSLDPDELALSTGAQGFVHKARAQIVLATEPHREILLQRLRKDVDVDAAIRQGTYVSLDAAENPDPVRFSDIVKSSLEAARKVAKAEHPRVAFCGERAGRLWAEGKLEEAIRLEQFCDELAGTYDVDILCAYPISLHDQEGEHALKRICEGHSTVHSY